MRLRHRIVRKSSILKTFSLCRSICISSAQTHNTAFIHCTFMQNCCPLRTVKLVQHKRLINLHDIISIKYRDTTARVSRQSRIAIYYKTIQDSLQNEETSTVINTRCIKIPLPLKSLRLGSGFLITSTLLPALSRPHIFPYKEALFAPHASLSLVVM